VRRNNWEEIRDIHDRLQSFALAFDNDLKEREKAEQEDTAGVVTQSTSSDGGTREHKRNLKKVTSRSFT
jgi:hypothetical protein